MASQLVEEASAHAQSDSLEDAREICADGTYFPINLRIMPDFKPLSYRKTVNLLATDFFFKF